MNNELAIKILENALYEPMATLAFARTSTPQDRIKCDELGAEIKNIKSAIELLKNPKEFDEIDMMNAIEYGHDLAMQETTRTPEQWIEDYRKQKLTTESK